VSDFPFARSEPLEPAEPYTRLRADDPVSVVTLASGYPAYLVSRYDDVKTVLGDRRFSLAEIFKPGAPRYTHVQQPPGTLLSLDPPEHTRLRACVAREFGSRRVEQLRPRIQQVTDELLDRLAAAGPPADLGEGLAVPLPVTVICELLGVPAGDREMFRAWTAKTLSLATMPPEEAQQTFQNIVGYFYSLVARKRAQPGDDLISALVAIRDDDADRLSEHELIMMAMTLLLAGYESTVSFLAASIVRLLQEPAAYAALRGTPDTVASVVEETLRMNAHGEALLRLTTEDVELSGVTIPAGCPVIPAIDSANRDGKQFADPDEVLVNRTDGAHLTFGHGPHFCVGAPLARAEMQVALSTLARRFPGLKLAVPPTELRWRKSLAGGLDALPVTW
jgi:cytochrome P450